MLDLWSRRPGLPTNQVAEPGLLFTWNGGKLKSDKSGILCEDVPFLKSTHIRFSYKFGTKTIIMLKLAVHTFYTLLFIVYMCDDFSWKLEAILILH